MALIKCPECGEKVSDKVKTCIHCGYPLKGEEDTSSNPFTKIETPEECLERIKKELMKDNCPLPPYGYWSIF